MVSELPFTDFKYRSVKMWRYLPVSKANSDNNTAPPGEYEKTRTRKFTPKWQVGRPWLQNDEKGTLEKLKIYILCK